MAINKITDKPSALDVTTNENFLITKNVTSGGETVEDLRKITYAILVATAQETTAYLGIS